MKTYTAYEHDEFTIYVSDDTGKVHHAANYNTTQYNIKTLYPYEPANGGWDNACDKYTLRQIKNRLKNGKISFK